MGEIIYEKHFHKETIEEIERERIDFVEAFGEDAEQAPSFDEIMKKIYSNVTYLVLPEREKMAKTFIKTAIEISNDYELDIEIEEHLSHISAPTILIAARAWDSLEELLRCRMTSPSLTTLRALIWSCPSTFTQRLYSKGIGLFSPDGLTWAAERRSGFICPLMLRELATFL